MWEKRFIRVGREMGMRLVNQTEGGEAPMAGKKHSEETRRKLSIAGRGRVQSVESVEKRRLAMKGRKFSPQHCENMSKSQRGKRHSEAHKQKISAGTAGVKNPHWGKLGRAHPAFGTKRLVTTSRFRGVAWDASRGKWRAWIHRDRRHTTIGRFDSELDAAQARRDAELTT